ncbi:unnamed protein product [Arabidopsis halleri]
MLLQIDEQNIQEQVVEINSSSSLGVVKKEVGHVEDECSRKSIDFKIKTIEETRLKTVIYVDAFVHMLTEIMDGDDMGRRNI